MRTLTENCGNWARASNGLKNHDHQINRSPGHRSCPLWRLEFVSLLGKGKRRERECAERSRRGCHHRREFARPAERHGTEPPGSQKPRSPGAEKLAENL